MRSVNELSERAFSHARRHDVVQIELRGEHLQSNISTILEGDANLSDFENLRLRTVQSNWAVMTESELEVVVQVIHNPRGGGKRALETMLDCEIIDKKRRFLHLVKNRQSTVPSM